MRKRMKLRSNSNIILNRVNEIIKDFSSKNNYFCKPIELNDENRYIGSINFGQFIAYFCFDEDAMFGYRFMETPLVEKDNDLDFNISLLTRIKFTFSKIAFSLYDIHNVINSKEFVTLDYHEIMSIEDVDRALTTILNFINNNLHYIGAISVQSDLQLKLVENYFNDVKAMKKKMTEEKFYADIEDQMENHEIRLYSNCNLDEQIDKFVCKGSYTDLTKRAIKLEEKNKLLIFEKRYTDYLAQNGYPVVDVAITARRKDKSRTKGIRSIIKLIMFILAGAVGIFLYFFTEAVAQAYFYEDSVFLGSYEHTISLWFMIFGLQQVFARMLYFIPKIKSKFGYPGILSSSDKKTVNILSLLGVAALIVGCFLSVYHIKNHTIVMTDSAVYIEHEVAEKGEIEFFYIEGYLNADGVIEKDPEDTAFYYVIDGEYEDYIWCDGLYDETGYLDEEIAKKLKNLGFEVQTYPCIEDYCTDHGFDYYEE